MVLLGTYTDFTILQWWGKHEPFERKIGLGSRLRLGKENFVIRMNNSSEIWLEHLSSPPIFSVVCVAQCLVFCVVLCRSLFVFSVVRVAQCLVFCVVLCRSLFVFSVVRVAQCLVFCLVFCSVDHCLFSVWFVLLNV